MNEWANAHPILATILAFPVVITACLILAGVCGVSIRRSR